MELYEPLMAEHKLMEKLFSVVKKEIKSIESTKKANTAFINILADFFTTYVDIYHHGKEENLLFKKLAEKNLSKKHKDLMNELLKEHEVGREMMEALLNSAKAYSSGSQNEIENIKARLKDFIQIYSEHIRKEDEDFFIPCMQYLTKQENEELIQDFWRYTIKMIDKKYERILDLLKEQ